MENNHHSFKKQLKSPVNFWNNLPSGAKTTFKLLPIVLILSALPLTVWFLQFQQNLRSNAADIPPPIKSVTVSSIPALLTTLADNTVDEIIVTNGTYQISPSGQLKSNSLWIGRDPIAARTRHITVRAETIGGVTFDGSGATGAFGALSFEDGAHDQTWDGFRFTNMNVEYTGVIEVGGYLPRRTPYNITIRNMTITSSCIGRATTASGSSWDHAVYLAHAVGTGPHDILIENLNVDGRGNLASAVHIYHGDATNPGSWNVTVKNMNVIGTQTAVFTWVDGLHDVTFDGATIRDVKAYGIWHNSPGAQRITYKNITTINSGQKGFFSSQGENPPGVTFINDNFDGVIYNTPNLTITPTNLPSATPTKAPTPTPTKSPTPTPTKTPTPTPTKAPTPTPIATNTPSPTPIANSTVLRFQKVLLHGIGKGGDNTNPTSTGTTNPVRTSRSLAVELIDSSGNTLPSVNGTITYQGSTLGYFSGDIVLPTTLSTGSYLIKIKSPQYLKKQVVGIITVTKGAITTIPSISLATGDIDNNNALTIADYNVLTDCYSDLLPPKNCSDTAKKQSADISDDGSVNANDYNLFLRELSVVAGD